MKALRAVHREAHEHWVGDGFPVRTIFSHRSLGAAASPFLLLDWAGPADFPPTEARRGVGRHPHRGFETVTIVLQGEVEHRDSAGNHGVIGPGDVQWMTAASGVVHEEFHGRDFSRAGGVMEMVQLWVNLPAKDKRAPPAYQELKDRAFPRVALGEGSEARVIAGRLGGATGPARTFTPVDLWDVTVAAGTQVELTAPDGHTALLLVLRGTASLNGGQVGEGDLVELDRRGERVVIAAETDNRLLFLGGAPILEPLAAYGPFVMNTEAEIEEALRDVRSGRLA